MEGPYNIVFRVQYLLGTLLDTSPSTWAFISLCPPLLRPPASDLDINFSTLC